MTPRPARLLRAAVLLTWCALYPGCACLTGDLPPGETVETLTRGDETELREELRPIRGTVRVILVALDGVGNDDLRLALSEGRMPELAAIVGEPVEPNSDELEHGYAASEVLTTMPSTTLAAWTTIYTGEPPARHGIAGNEWFDRRADRFFAPAPVTVPEQDHVLETMNDGLVNQQVRVPTLFERADLRSHVSMAHVYRGADLYTVQSPLDLVALMSTVVDGVLAGGEFSSEAFEEIDNESVDTIIEAIENEGVPDLQVAYFPGIDLASHIAPDPIEMQQSHLEEVIDPALGRLFDEYRERGALDDTWVVVVADHGHTEVTDDDEHALHTDEETDPPAVAKRTGYRLRPFHLEPEEDERDYQVAFAYQGALAYVYVADRSTCPNPGDRCDWSEPPRYEEDVWPLARAFLHASEGGVLVPEMRDTLDAVFTRRPTPADEPARPFQVLHGDELMPIEQWLRSNGREDFLELAERMDGLGAGPFGHHAGDIVLMTRSGTERPIEGRYYFSAPYSSWHGSAHEQDSVVPLVVGRLGADGAAVRRRVESVLGDERSVTRVTPLVLELLREGG